MLKILQMGQAIAIEDLAMHNLMQKSQLKRTRETDFFSEWRTSLPDLTEFETTRLAHVRAIYQDFENRSALLDNTVGLTVVSPLLDAAGLFVPPFYMETEESVEIIAQDGALTIRGRLDTAIIRDLIWILTIEAERAAFSPIVGLSQVLSSMLAAPTHRQQLYGMVTSGRNFIFVKLDRADREPIFAESDEFILRRGDDLEQIFRILKRLANIAVA